MNFFFIFFHLQRNRSNPIPDYVKVIQDNDINYEKKKYGISFDISLRLLIVSLTKTVLTKLYISSLNRPKTIIGRHRDLKDAILSNWITELKFGRSFQRKMKQSREKTVVIKDLVKHAKNIQQIVYFFLYHGAFYVNRK